MQSILKEICNVRFNVMLVILVSIKNLLIAKSISGFCGIASTYAESNDLAPTNKTAYVIPLIHFLLSSNISR